MAKIILTEDDTALAKIFAIWLEADGHSVVTGINGMEGFRSFVASQECDLLVTDLMMPEVNGEELIRMFPLLAPGIPIIVVTASSDRELLKEIARCEGVSKVMSKPVSAEELTGAVRQALSAAA
jgi:DNA-binding NtrC family response regulator